MEHNYEKYQWKPEPSNGLGMADNAAIFYHIILDFWQSYKLLFKKFVIIKDFM
jgi:hypothetical protein